MNKSILQYFSSFLPFNFSHSWAKFKHTSCEAWWYRTLSSINRQPYIWVITTKTTWAAIANWEVINSYLQVVPEKWVLRVPYSRQDSDRPDFSEMPDSRDFPEIRDSRDFSKMQALEAIPENSLSVRQSGKG